MRQPTLAPIRPTIARLTVHINGSLYQVLPVAAQASDVIKAWRLRKADGTDYCVADTLDGATCECADYVFRHDGRDHLGCKHIQALRSVGLIDDDAGDVSEWPAWTDTHAYATRR